MNIEKLTNRSREALLSAQSIAQENGNPELNTLHLLKAMLDQDDSLAASLLQRSDIPLTRVAGKVENAIEKLPKVSGGSRHVSGRVHAVLCADPFAESQRDTGSCGVQPPQGSGSKTGRRERGETGGLLF